MTEKNNHLTTWKHKRENKLNTVQLKNKVFEINNFGIDLTEGWAADWSISESELGQDNL